MKTKRILSVLLALVMLCSALPLVSVGADASPKTAEQFANVQKFMNKELEATQTQPVSTFKKGLKCVYKTACFTLTMTVISVTKEEYNLESRLVCEKGYEDLFYIPYSDDEAGFYRVDTSNYPSGTGLTYDYQTVMMDRNSLKAFVDSGVITESDLRDYDYEYHNNYRFYFVCPEKVKLDLSFVKVTKNSIDLGQPYGMGIATNADTTRGTIVSYRESGAKKWTKKTFKYNGKNMVLKKLKAGTEYELKLSFFEKKLDSASGKYVTGTGDYTEVYKLSTGMATAPEIKSVKITGVKTQKSKKSGHYDAWGTWYPGYDDAYTQVKMTVTLKERPKTMKALKCLNGDWSGGVVKGKGNKFTFTMVMTGDYKNKKVKLSFVGISNILKQDGEVYYLGESKAATKSVTLK